MKNFRKNVAAAVLACLMFTVAVPSASAVARVKRGVDTNPAIEDTTPKDTLRNVKKYLTEHEPPAEPFFVRLAWGLEGGTEEVDWDVLVTANYGRVYVRKPLNLEKGQDVAARGRQRIGNLNKFKIRSVTGDGDNYDGVELIYWKPVLKGKDEIKFSFKLGDYEFEQTLADLQKKAYQDEEVDMAAEDWQMVYADAVNYDTKKGEFNKRRTELVFLNWGNVAGTDMSKLDPEDYVRHYEVTASLVNAGESRIGYVGTVYFEEESEYHIDEVVKGETGSEFVARSTIGGGVDGVILALETNKTFSGLPFETRGLKVKVVDITEEIEAEEVGLNDVVASTVAVLGESCEQDSECGSEDEVCIENVCSPAVCETDDDCGTGATCDEGVCDYSGDDSEVCDDDNPCPEGYACEEGICMEELLPCESDEDCEGGYSCDPDEGVCIQEDTIEPQCSEDDPCDEGYTCEEGVCVEEEDVVPSEEKVVFEKTFTSAEQFGKYDFEDNSSYGVRIVNGTFLWNNTPNILKVVAVVKIASTIRHMIWAGVIKPRQIVAVAIGLGAAAKYVQHVNEALFGGDYTYSTRAIAAINKYVDTQVKQKLTPQWKRVVPDEEALKTCEESCEELVDEEEMEEFEDLVDEEIDNFDEFAAEQVNSDPQTEKDEGLIVFYDVEQAEAVEGEVTPTWYFDYVRVAYEDNIIGGYKTPEGQPKWLFGPADNVTRSQLAKIAANAAGMDDELDLTFNESSGTNWYDTYTEAFVEAGFEDIKEWVDRDPNKAAMRDEVAKVFVNAMLVEPEAPEDGNYYFTDIANDVFKDHIYYLYELNVVSGIGNSNTYGPTLNVNRAEASKIATLVSQLCGAAAVSEDIPTGEIEGAYEGE